ncbi:MAG: hypothetical protein WC731_00685 [Candidatus Omnitrophota bacterium]|jgi:hypothetical protein
MRSSQHTLSPQDFEKIFKEKLSLRVKNRIKKYNLKYADVTPVQRDACLKKIVSVLFSEGLMCSGEHRQPQWEKGWGQNLAELSSGNSKSAIKPHYFGKYPINRLMGEFIRPVSKNFEYNMLGVILDWLFDKYLKGYKNIYEFGCGTGHNLVRLRLFYPDADLWGLDWARSSQALIKKYALINSDKNLFAHKFDYFAPDNNFKLKSGSAVYTVASLEQIGSRYSAFVDYLLKNKPGLCIHVEPIAELLDENNLMDYLSISYFKKRNYLCGYLSYLRDLESKGKLKIIKAKRSHIGSFFIEGYSVIIWAPAA